MEDYDKFVQRCLSRLRSSEEEEEEEEEGHNKPSPSLIRFYGLPILPPLLSGEQREEMQRHRDAAQEAAVHTKLQDDARMAYVQTILHSVQLRNTPTLEELLQESEVNSKSSYSHNTSGGSVSQSSYFMVTKDSLSLSPPPERKEKDSVSLSPFTSTTYCAFFASNVTPLQSYQEGCLIDQHYSQQGSQPNPLNSACHQSESSGYATFENAENTTSVSGRIDAGRESHGFGSSKGAYNMAGFFLYNTSNTITKMPDIISHPPIDGDELERSGLESSFCSDFIVVKDTSFSSCQEESVMCDHLPVERSKSNQEDSTEGEDNLPVTTVLDFDEDHNLDQIEGPVPSSENIHSDNPELSQTLSSHCPTAELHIQHNPTETEPLSNHVDEAEPSEEPYRLSLQALLKKSQEYRRRQRMLRNQAKNTKIQERTQEQPRARTEEQNLSDKENDEFPYKGTVTAEGKKTKEKKGTFIRSVETPPKKFVENESMIECDFFGKRANSTSESTHLTGDGKTKEMTSVEEETTKNNKLNLSQEIRTEPKQISAFPQQQPMSSEASPVQEAFYLTTSPTAFHKEVWKYHTIPTPNFCRSPVHCKSKGSIQDGEAVDVAETSKRNILVNTGLNEDHKVEEVNLGHHSSPTAVPSTVNLTAEADVTGVLTKSSQHIDQLESNLSGLKVLISDLESTLTENLGNHSQTESNTQSEFSFEGFKHSEQIKNEHVQLHQSDCDNWEEKLRDDDNSNDAEEDQRYREWPRRQSLDNYKNLHEDTEPEPSISDMNNVPVIVEVKGTELGHLSELSLVKPIATERGKEKGTCKQGLTKSYGQHGGSRQQQPPPKCILSAAQRLRIPDIFRNGPSESTAPRNVSVLSDASNHPVEGRNEMAVEDHDSTHLPSLNQSYDVDAPSGLWLLDGSGSDLGSKGHLVQEKHLTPESGGEGQAGGSKVKRRLLMQMTEETRERSADTSRGTDSVVRPNSSTPKAAGRRQEAHGSQKDKQEQLKQAHAAQVRALQDEHRRQQEDLLQALAVRYRLLQSVSFPCSMSSSRLGDTLTFSTLSQPSSPLSERYRPLLLAAVKGFLTRRLLRTERVAQLVRTIRDTQQFLQALQRQSPGRAEFCSRQDILLQERVTLQLRAARYEVSDIFFSLSAGERMQLISWDRELAREREHRRQSGHTGRPRGKSSLSAATQKSLERKRGIMIQKKAAGRHRGVVTKTGHNSGSSGEQPPETKRGQFRANPQRVPKSTYSSRPR
ncbi:uncharacterized protein si:ch73-100l22.3 [Morone saxatilis]|uniref:uncharacterized protein si:ch73-100l22.3 n=1 Tax=Morone saxatilis TaxID=34816 RepID=UPI0015E22E33|nr:uncharacterized protein si:ch73-100l22.3 [Morone saxatilis]